MDPTTITVIAVITAIFLTMSLVKAIAESRSTSVRLAEQQLRSSRQIAVAKIAGDLISAMLANPKYWEEYQRLQATAIGTVFDQSKSEAERSADIKEIEKQKMDLDVFNYDGRRQFMELAWNIYLEAGSQDPDRE